ncbi:MAG: undecaprenyldiphospho-muramoylpentapeptide beta-N-acetylglucosaminyltransferase [Acidobacteriota bacterium]|nr:MAG: undecaprenyldiphospho-muramoylpentapeptide beta-N-acetylglucosaminyltransferase [Acidobacteriota bacterium]
MRGNSLLVAAGGTGGHLYPALAVAERFQELVEKPQVTFVGTERGLESRIVPKAGFPLEFVRAAPLRGGSLFGKLKGLWGLVQGMRDSLRLLKRLKPSVVLGVGAYVSGTVLLAAALRGTPTLILEPNAEPGLANKWLAPFVDEAACAWEETTRYFGDKGVLTGNPVRQSIFDVPPSAEQGSTMRVLVLGGSQGSEVLNDALTASLPVLASARGQIELLHQTGTRHLDKVKNAYAGRTEQAGQAIQARVTAYIDDMAEAYAWSDLVLTRAGATTCAELAACGRPSLLVPLPLAGGHQEANAEMLARAGAARWIRESELTPDELASQLMHLLDAPRERETMAVEARSLARPEATGAVAERLVHLARLAHSGRGEAA